MALESKTLTDENLMRIRDAVLKVTPATAIYLIGPRTPEQWASTWFEYAESDMYLAQIHESDEEFVRHVCFLAQQTAERYLKGFLAFSDRSVPKTHELDALARKCGIEDADFDAWEQVVVALSDYAVSVRYPDGIVVIMSDAIRALTVARDVCDFVHQKIEESKAEQDDAEMDDSR